MEKWKFSLEAANEAVKYSSYDARVHILLAQLHFLKRDCPVAKQEANDQLCSSIRQISMCFNHYWKMSFSRDREYDQALSLFTALDRKYPDKVEIMHMKAVAHLAKNELPETQAICKKILADYPGYVPAVQMLVDIALRNIETLAEAMDLVKTQLEKEPENVDYLLMLGKLNLFAGKNEEALSTYSRKPRNWRPRHHIHIPCWQGSTISSWKNRCRL